MVKQRRESLEQLKKRGGRPCKKERFELGIPQGYMPEPW
jgi:uncharacterized protein YqeY